MVTFRWLSDVGIYWLIGGFAAGLAIATIYGEHRFRSLSPLSRRSRSRERGVGPKPSRGGPTPTFQARNVVLFLREADELVDAARFKLDHATIAKKTGAWVNPPGRYEGRDVS